MRFGKRAAQRIIDLRADDGRYAPLEFTKPVGPGVWRPTAEQAVPFAPFSTTWMAELEPLVLADAEQFRPGPPPAMTSARYARQYNEVKDLGRATESTRTPRQTKTALFFSDIGVGGLQAALRDLATRREMNISDSARLLAVANVAAADGFVSAWDAKFHYGFWRPSTAIQLGDTDGNDATDPDPTWKPLILNPPYPDYTSGLNTAVGAISRSVARVLGTNRIDLFITSTAAGQTRHYRFAGPLNRAAINARIWSGLHFRSADVVGNHRRSASRRTCPSARSAGSQRFGSTTKPRPAWAGRGVVGVWGVRRRLSVLDQRPGGLHPSPITARAVAATARSTPSISPQRARAAPASWSRTSRVGLWAGGGENRSCPLRHPSANSRSLISLRHSCAGTPLPATASAIQPAWRSASLVPSGSRPTMCRQSACGSWRQRVPAAVGASRPLRTLTSPRARAVRADIGDGIGEVLPVRLADPPVR